MMMMAHGSLDMYDMLTYICKGTIHKHVNISAIMVT